MYSNSFLNNLTPASPNVERSAYRICDSSNFVNNELLSVYNKVKIYIILVNIFSNILRRVLCLKYFFCYIF